jgi:hypothetical protein
MIAIAIVTGYGSALPSNSRQIVYRKNRFNKQLTTLKKLLIIDIIY